MISNATAASCSFARDVGQVRDVLSRQEADQPVAIRTYPTVQAAVTAALPASREAR